MVVTMGDHAASARDLRVYSANYVPGISIPDGPFGGGPGSAAIGTLFVPDHGVITDVDVDMVIRHTFQGDLVVRVMAPDGTMITLIDRPGSPPDAFGFSADNFGVLGNEFVSDDEASRPYDAPFIASPGIDNVGGHWQPYRPLSTFDGIDKFGEWKIIVTDNAFGQIGFIDRFSLHFTNIPGPASISILLSAGLLFTRRRRSS